MFNSGQKFAIRCKHGNTKVLKTHKAVVSAVAIYITMAILRCSNNKNTVPKNGKIGIVVTFWHTRRETEVIKGLSTLSVESFIKYINLKQIWQNGNNSRSWVDGANTFAMLNYLNIYQTLKILARYLTPPQRT